MSQGNSWGECPIPISDYPNILLAHGGGGKLMQQLIDKIFLPAFDNPTLQTRHDGALLNLSNSRLAFTTDSYVVKPLFFPGGDIGTLAINGTVNDLAMCGARPAYISAGFILEEGLPIDTLWKIAQSMRRAADEAEVNIVTGDTKVVERGKGDGIYINTAGIGLVEHDQIIMPANIKSGDSIILSGDLGRHGIAVMAAREGLAFESAIESDCAPLTEPIMSLLKAKVTIHCLRDLTRGGLAAALVEIAQTAKWQLLIDESSIAVSEPVRGACEILGFDPLHVVNEGRFIAFISPDYAKQAMEILRRFPNCREAAIIGEVTNQPDAEVILKSKLGVKLVLDLPAGEQLPRIC